MPCAVPKMNVSVGKPGAIQKKQRAAKTVSSTQLAIFTQRQSRPGAGARRPSLPVASAASVKSLRAERREDDALLLEPVGRRVALRRRGAWRAADVAEVDSLRDELGHAAEHDAPRAHVLRLLLDPEDLLQVRILGEQGCDLVPGEGVQELDPGERDGGGVGAALVARH